VFDESIYEDEDHYTPTTKSMIKNLATRVSNMRWRYKLHLINNDNIFFKFESTWPFLMNILSFFLWNLPKFEFHLIPKRTTKMDNAIIYIIETERIRKGVVGCNGTRIGCTKCSYLTCLYGNCNCQQAFSPSDLNQR
jgi:hypothetical protein